jgi:hypothetical protein
MASPSYNNVHFVGVARIDGEGIVVASYSHHAAIDIGGVKQVLGQPNLNISAGKHYVFSIGSSAWHLIGGTRPHHHFSCVLFADALNVILVSTFFCR